MKSASSNLVAWKVSSKTKKTLNLGPKIPCLGFFGLQFNKNYYQILDSTLEFVKLSTFNQNEKK